jgi:hypothetical protein
MTPREEIANQILETKSGDITKTLKPFAIGKWVPVSERLPEFGRSNMWSGTFKADSGRVMTAQCHKDVFGTRYVTHWLELDLPEVEE